MKHIVILGILTCVYIYLKGNAKRKAGHKYIHEPSTFSDVDIKIIRDKLKEIEKEIRE